jgi:hypothetical protein
MALIARRKPLEFTMWSSLSWRMESPLKGSPTDTSHAMKPYMYHDNNLSYFTTKPSFGFEHSDSQFFFDDDTYQYMTDEHVLAMAVWIWYHDDTPKIKRYRNGNKESCSMCNIFTAILISVMLPDPVRACQLIPMHYLSVAWSSITNLLAFNIPLYQILTFILFLQLLRDTKDANVNGIFGVDHDDRYHHLCNANLKGISAILDSGASLHLFNQKNAFKNIDYTKENQLTFTVANGNSVRSKGIGTVVMKLFNMNSHTTDFIQLENVAYFPDAPLNLVSLRQLEIDCGLYANFLKRRLVKKKCGDNYMFVCMNKKYWISEDSDDIFAIHNVISKESSIIPNDSDKGDDIAAILRSGADITGKEKDQAPVNTLETKRPLEDFDLRLSNEHMETLSSTIGACDFELFADKWHSHFADFMNEGAEKFKWKGRSFFGHLSLENEIIHQTLLKALDDWQRNPKETAFTFLIPRMESEKWWSLTKQFQVIQKYPKGTRCFGIPKNKVSVCDEKLLQGASVMQPACDTDWLVIHKPKACIIIADVTPSMLAHLRFAHCGASTLKKLFSDKYDMGLTRNTSVLTDCCNSHCSTCKLTKSVRPSPNREERTPSKEPFNKVFLDIHGPLMEGAEGSYYIMAFIDDYSRYVMSYKMKTRAQATEILEQYSKDVAYIRGVAGYQGGASFKPTVRILQSDCPGEFTSKEFEELVLKTLGAAHRYSSAYKHENQAMIEVVWKDIVAKTRALLSTAGLHVNLWPYAFQHAVYIRNRLPRKALGGKSSYEMIYNEKPILSQVKVFGSKAYAFVDAGLRKKLDNRTEEMIYVGHSDNSQCYILLDLKDPKRTKLSGMVKFDEQSVLAKDPKTINCTQPLNMHFDITKSAEDTVTNISSRYVTSVTDHHVQLEDSTGNICGTLKVFSNGEDKWIYAEHFMTEGIVSDDPPQPKKQRTTSKKMSRKVQLERWNQFKEQTTVPGLVSPYYPIFSEVNYTETDSDKSGTILEKRTVDSKATYKIIEYPSLNIKWVEQECISWECDHTFGVTLKSHTAPATHAQAMSSPDSEAWTEARLKEFKSILEKGTLDLRKTLPPGTSAVGTSLKYKIKYNKDGTIEKLKCRLVAQGFKQEYEINYNNTFAPGTQLSSLRLLIALALRHNLSVQHVDVVTAFLNAKLEEEVYVRFPNGIEFNGCKFAKLKKSIYGLKQAAHDWNKLSNKSLKNCIPGIKRSEKEPCLFYLMTKNLKVLILVHVDDYFVACSDMEWYNKTFLPKFRSEFEINELGEIDQALGIGIYWDRKSHACHLSQTRYILALVDKEIYELNDWKRVDTPMEDSLKLAPAKECDHTLPYRNLLGELAWIARASRPDILFAVSYMARFSLAHDSTHWTHLKRIGRYLLSTADMTLTLRSTSDKEGVKVTAYVDADFANDPIERKSVSGNVVCVDNVPVIFNSNKQEILAGSSTESELIALTSCAKECLYIHQLVSELETVRLPMAIHEDNAAAISNSTNRTNSSRTKHIHIRYLQCRNWVEEGLLNIFYIKSTDNVADTLTKSLGKILFVKHTDWLMGKMGLKTVRFTNSTKKE